MEAVLPSVAGSLPQLKSQVVCLMCDNIVVVSCIINEGGTKSFRLTCLTIPFLKFYDPKGIRLVPIHPPGSRNIQADALSHVGQTLPTEWVVASSSVPLMGNTSDRSVRDFCLQKAAYLRITIPGPEGLIRQCHASSVGWEWCTPSHHSKCYRLYSTRFTVPMICQWFC